MLIVQEQRESTLSPHVHPIPALNTFVTFSALVSAVLLSQLLMQRLTSSISTATETHGTGILRAILGAP